MKIVTLFLYITAYLYIIFEPQISSVTTVLFGITAVLVTSHFNFSNLSTIIDFNTIFILTGMMIIISVLKERGVFTEISKIIIKLSNGNMLRAVFLINISIFFLSGFLDNVTTILIFIPILFYIADTMQVDSKPLLINAVLFSNLGGMTTAIGDPPNIIIYSVSHQTFSSFLLHLMPIGILVLVSQLLLLKRSLRDKSVNLVFETNDVTENLKNKGWKQYFLFFLVIVCLMIFHEQLGIELGIITMLGGMLILFFENRDVQSIVLDIDWDTLVLIMGLYFLNFSLEQLRLFEPVVTILSRISTDSVLILIVLWSAIFLSGFFSSLPVTLLYLSVIQKLVSMGRPNSLYWALVLGVGIGGNLTPVASMCNIVGNNLLKNLKNEKLNFIEFTKNMLKPVVMSGIISSVVLYIFSLVYN